MHQDVAPQHLGQRFVAEVTGRWISAAIGKPFVPPAPVLLRLNPGVAIASDVPHPRRRAATGIDALRVLPARHLETILRVGKLHRLHRARGNHLEHHAAPAYQIRRTGKHLKCGYPAREYPRKLWILRPNRMLGPDVRRHRVGRLVAIREGVAARRRVDSQMRMHVDQSGCNELAGAVDDDRVGRRLNRRTDSLDLAVAQQD